MHYDVLFTYEGEDIVRFKRIHVCSWESLTSVFHKEVGRPTVIIRMSKTNYDLM